VIEEIARDAHGGRKQATKSRIGVVA